MKNKEINESLLRMSIDSLPISEEAKIRIKRFHINTVRDLLKERAIELDQLIGPKYINEIRLFMIVNDLLFQDGQPLELELDFQKFREQVGDFELRQFDFKNADCYPTFHLWNQYLLYHRLKLVSFQELLGIQFDIRSCKRLISQQDVEINHFGAIQCEDIVDIDPNSLVQDGDCFMLYKL